MSVQEIAIKKKLDKEITYIVKHSNVQKFVEDMDHVSFEGIFKNKILLAGIIDYGVTFKFFELFSQAAPFDDTAWAGFLDISTKTLQRYRESEQHFKPRHSEKIIEMAEVTNIGLDVFSSMEKFKLWLEMQNYALGNLKPVDLLTNSYGKDLVIGELTRINHGIFA